MHVVTGNKRRAPIPTKSQSTPFSLFSEPKNRGDGRVVELAREAERV